MITNGVFREAFMMLRSLNGIERTRGQILVYEFDGLLIIVPSLNVSKKQYFPPRFKGPLFNPRAYNALSRIANETGSSSRAAACFIS